MHEEVVKIILNHGSIVHGGYIRDSIAGVPHIDIDVIASPQFIEFLKTKGVEIKMKVCAISYGNVNHATAEFMGEHLDLMLVRDSNVCPTNRFFFTEDFECNSLYMSELGKYHTRSTASVKDIIEQIKNKIAVPTHEGHTTYKTIMRHLDRSYKMYMKGYKLPDSVKPLTAIGSKWYTMEYNGVVYDRYELQAKIERSKDLSESCYSYVDPAGVRHQISYYVVNAHSPSKK